MNYELEQIKLHYKKIETDLGNLKKIIAKTRSYGKQEFQQELELIRDLRIKIENLEIKVGEAEKIINS